ncbi:MAG TPA: TlpA disulfide reductase family protein [Phycisphaerales bacterium]|nr:TlpA disulfide reductase family protein [Phycisphaerales bacterium]
MDRKNFTSRDILSRSLLACATPWLVAALSGAPAAAQDGAEPATVTPQPGPGSSADPAVIDRLRAVAETISAAQTISFRLRTSATGNLTNGTPVVDFGVRMARIKGIQHPWLIRIDGEGKRRPSSPPQEVTAAFDDSTVTWLDHEKKLLNVKAARSARGQDYQLIYAARITEIMTAQPLSRELTAIEAGFESAVEFDGVMCDVITLKSRAGASKTRWWIGQADNLPRKIEKMIESATAGGSSTTEFLQIKTGENFSERDLAITLPEGYAKGETESSRGISVPPRPQQQSTDSQDHTEGVRPQTPAVITPPPTDESRSPDREPVEQPRTPLDLMLTDSEGAKVELASLRGRPVVLLFMATWSLPSRSLLEQAEELHVAIGSRVPILALAVKERYPEQVAAFIKERKSTLRVFPRSDEAAAALKVGIVPAVVVLDAGGMVAQTIQGVTRETWPRVWEEVAKVGGPPAPARAQPAEEGAKTEPAPEGAGHEGVTK